MWGEGQQVRIPCHQCVGLAGHDDRQDLVITGIAADARHLGGGDDFAQGLELAAGGAGAIRTPGADLHEDRLQLREDGVAGDQVMLTPQYRLQNAARPAAEMEGGDEDVGVKDNAHSARRGSASQATSPLHRGGNPFLGQRASTGSGLPVGEELFPAVAPLRVLAESFPEDLATGTALLASQ